MIPIRDATRSETYPIVNNLIIAINIFVFFIELAQGQRLSEFIYTYGIVPARYSVPQISGQFTASQQVISFLTFMFLHGGFFHLLGNMWFLYIFGDNVEDKLGHFRYLIFYLLCGLASGISHLVLNWLSEIPTIGASGAIAGVMGAYLILFPRARVLTLIPIFFLPYFVELPALFFLGVWFMFQFLSAAGSSAHAEGVAWWAHVGGFIFGIIFLKLFQMIPESNIGKQVRQLTKKRTTPRIHMIRAAGFGNDANLYGSIDVSEREAYFGARKFVNINLGPKKKTLFVTIPPGVSEGTKLRLKGLGHQTTDGVQGDLYLEVRIKR
jgi:membrane associated rhomboid family serine protease